MLFSIPKKISITSFVSNTVGSRLKSTSVMGRLSGKVAVVTASTDGIGFAMAKRLAIEGAKVVVSSRMEANVNAAVTSLKDCGLQNNISGVVCHVGKSEDRKKLYEEAIDKFGGIDTLISNAAINPFFGPAADCPEESWDEIFDINVKSSFLLTKEVLPYMRQRNGGSIIYISSIVGLRSFRFLGPYSVSKSALIRMTEVFANELASSHIRVNCIAPGLVRTKFLESFETEEMQTKIEDVVPRIPMNRLAEPRDIAGTAAFLCSQDAKYITGETILVSGGWGTAL